MYVLSSLQAGINHRVLINSIESHCKVKTNATSDNALKLQT